MRSIPMTFKHQLRLIFEVCNLPILLLLIYLSLLPRANTSHTKYNCDFCWQNVTQMWRENLKFLDPRIYTISIFPMTSFRVKLWRHWVNSSDIALIAALSSWSIGTFISIKRTRVSCNVLSQNYFVNFVSNSIFFLKF